MLGPYSTIKYLVTSNEEFSVGSIATIMVACEKNTSQYELISIKDGNTSTDYAIAIPFLPQAYIF